MKALALLSVFGMVAAASFGQEVLTPEERMERENLPLPVEKTVVESDSLSFPGCEIDPEFPGGSTALRRYMRDHLNYPPAEICEGFVYSQKCYLKFIVDTAGRISNVTVIKGISDCPECDAEAVRVIENMPLWKPKKINGKPVNACVNFPVTFQHD
jgi:periplasmic protein TonB